MQLVLVYVLIFFVACTSNKSLVQTEQHVLTDIKVRADIMEIDEFGFIYVVNAQNTIVKYNQKGEKLFEYAPNQWGDIESIDVRDPFKIAVFFPDFQKVKIIDNTLSDIGEFELQNITFDISIVAMSNDNDLWIYDQADNRIKKLSNSGAIVVSSQPISDIVGAAFRPSFFKEIQNQIYCYDPNYGLLVFDYSAHFIKRYTLLHQQITDIETLMIIGISNNSVEIYSDFENKIELLDSDVTNINLEYKPKVVRRLDDQWIVLTRNGIILNADFKPKE